MHVTETTEFNLDGQGSLILRLEDDFLGITTDQEIILNKHELQELIDKLSYIASYMADPNDDENE